MKIEGYFSKVNCPKCGHIFYPLVLSADNDAVLIGKVPLVSASEKYGIVINATPEEWENWQPDLIAERINKEKNRKDLFLPRFTLYVDFYNQKEYPELEQGRYFECPCCRDKMAKVVVEVISFEQFRNIGGVLEIE